jgi:regulator of protease activity HflC (stomatin/prohibitin superfamily)
MDVVLAALLGIVLYLFSGLRVLREYERAVSFFLGRSSGATGPGYTLIRK